jgi:hypothetical protein
LHRYGLKDGFSSFAKEAALSFVSRLSSRENVDGCHRSGWGREICFMSQGGLIT